VPDPGDVDLLIVPVTNHAPRAPEDVALRGWKDAGLRLPSTARMAKLTTLSKATVIRSMGQLTGDDTRTAHEVLSRFFAAVLR